MTTTDLPPTSSDLDPRERPVSPPTEDGHRDVTIAATTTAATTTTTTTTTIAATTTDEMSVDPRMRDRWVCARRAEGRRRLRILSGVVGLLSLVGVAFLVAQSPLLGAETVTVEGAGQTSVAQVRAAAKVEDGTPLLFLDTADVARRVESLPAVARAEVETELPNTVVVTVVERVPVAWIRTVGPSPIAVVDATGRVVRLAVAPPAGLPEVVGVGNVARLGTTVAKGVGFRGLAALPAALRGQPRTFTVSNGQASMTITGTPPTVGTVVFGPMTDMKRKGIAALAVIDDLVSRGQRVGELDVSVPDAPITRGPAPR